MLLNVLDFDGDLTAALDAAADGDRIYLPGIQPYTEPTGNGWIVSKSVEIFGDGPGMPGDSSGTLLRGHDVDAPVVVIAPADPDSSMGPVFIHDLKMADAQYGIRCTAGVGKTISSLKLERVLIVAMKKAAFSLDPGGRIEALTLLGCGAVNNREYGIRLQNVTRALVMANHTGTNDLGSYRLSSSGVACYGGSAESDGTAADPDAAEAQVHLVSCPIAHVESVSFEKFQYTNAIACKFVDCGGAAFFGSNYFAGESQFSTTGVKVGGSGPVVISSNNLIKVHPTLVDVDSTVNGCTIMPQYNVVDGGIPGGMVLPATPNYGLLGMPAVRNTIPASSGLAIPSLPSPPTNSIQDGMIYYDTDLEFLRVRVGGAWKLVSVSEIPPP